ncbi:3-dehydroquinate synthase [Gracilimonas tropica]|uniref:3-dehydroquinate synthase n=1 Tax=Gracilimonas tropica TaxID=454600 RepID=UPI000375C58A|nr:3-dehydroquinate synthase [Gracilimonas tropica]
MSDTIFVETSTQDNYKIHFGDDLSEELGRFINTYSSDTAFVLADAFVLEHHRDHFEPVLKQQFSNLHVFEIPQGEQAKSMKIYQAALDHVLKNGVERQTPLFAIGGGVTGDLAGFVAATALRGIPLIHIPTTLLSMVDSSIGGKTGINHTTGKNLIGSFYQPEAVFADVHYLQTLPKKEWVNGLSEVLKYGYIHSPEILQEAKQLIDKNVFTDGAAWLSLIKKSARIKVEVVSEDVLESGKRAILNFGHTFGHVLEREGNYEMFSHGEAVFAGMVAALHASNYLGVNIELSNLMQFKSLYEFNLKGIEKSPRELVEMMKFDKKVKDGQLRLILLKKEGIPYIYNVADEDFIEKAWQHTLNIFS